MKRIVLVFAVLLAAIASAAAQSFDVTSFRYAGPYEVIAPYVVDSLNVDGKPYKAEDMLKSKLSMADLKGAAKVSALPESTKDALHLLAFNIENTLFAKASIEVKGLAHHKVYVDGRPAEKELKLEPGTHEVVIKCFRAAGEQDSLKVSVKPEKEGRVSLREDEGRLYSLDINSMGIACGGVSISAGGKYISLGHKLISSNGKSEYYYEIIQTADNKVIARTKDYVRWMPTGDCHYYTRKTLEGRDLIVADPASLTERVLARNIPEGNFTISPIEDKLFYRKTQKGPKEGEVHEVLNPEDRHPGWRDRSYISMYDIKTGLNQPLTHGYHNAWLDDIAPDGSRILFSVSDNKFGPRPTSRTSLYEMDLATREVRTIVDNEGFASGAQYSPDGKKILMQGGADAFGGIGRKGLKEGQIPNAYHVLLFEIDLADNSVRPLTSDFGPSLMNARWSKLDGKIYMMVEDKDRKTIYRLNPANLKTEALAIADDYVYSFDMSDLTPVLVYSSQSLESADKAYVLNTKTGKQQVLYDFSAERLEGVQLGKGGAYEFTSSRGDLINGFYVLPPNFDPSKKYPLLVHYYGGCSPSARYCTGAYSPQLYAAQGYVFYVINPSGAAGNGQEFAARHVNTAGDVVSDDIIEGTMRFCEDHPFVDSSKIGCFSASYGGFMTQLLLTKTDLYAAGISHAGISDHTSYWGEGYWGYSYSEVSMADSYPWTRKDLYVDRSPLFNADKIHTPLLFLHGSADTNVPIGESIQMFTALKLLGAETSFVVVDGEDHGVVDFAKRRQWLRTIFAWFSKYLQDDSTWWDELYPEKNL